MDKHIKLYCKKHNLKLHIKKGRIEYIEHKKTGLAIYDRGLEGTNYEAYMFLLGYDVAQYLNEVE